MAADVGQTSACAGLQSRSIDSYERYGRRAKAPPQAEACPTWTGGPTLARKCEVIPAPALSHKLAPDAVLTQSRHAERHDALPVPCPKLSLPVAVGISWACYSSLVFLIVW